MLLIVVFACYSDVPQWGFAPTRRDNGSTTGIVYGIVYEIVYKILYGIGYKIGYITLKIIVYRILYDILYGIGYLKLKSIVYRILYEIVYGIGYGFGYYIKKYIPTLVLIRKSYKVHCINI